MTKRTTTKNTLRRDPAAIAAAEAVLVAIDAYIATQPKGANVHTRNDARKARAIMRDLLRDERHGWLD